MKNRLGTFAFCTTAILASTAAASISISVDANEGVKKISPFIYGRNIDGISDTDVNSSAEENAAISQMNEAGIRMVRANNGNNATKYNWQKKLTSHPDWFNNVYAHDWDITAKKIQDRMPQASAMYALQLTGYAAASTDYNFADWDYYLSHNKQNAKQTLNLAGGGEPSADGQSAVKVGDYKQYTEPWSAEKTVGILKHWKDELNYDMSRFQYWSMDNEMDIWANTHDDLGLDISGDFLVQRYVDVAKKARDTWSDVKLTGPVVANEWYWCSIAYKGGTSGRLKAADIGESRDYCWLEYFIKKVAEAQKASGTRLLDVLDIHWYPDERDYASQINWHRIFFDEKYDYLPGVGWNGEATKGANSIKQVNGGWDEKITKEYIFKRINDWLDKYFGENHGITLALTETDLGTAGNAMTTALIYASFLGTFMDNGVELFTPWTWREGMYEVVHLFSRYNQEYRVASVSSNDSLVSAYSSVDKAKENMTVILVNRAENSSQTVDLSLSNFEVANGSVKTLTLSGLSGETFESHTSNALKSGTANVSSKKLTVTLPAKSIMAVIVPKETDALPSESSSSSDKDALASRLTNSLNAGLHYSQGRWVLDNPDGSVNKVVLFDNLGKQVAVMNHVSAGSVMLNTASLNSGVYFVRMEGSSGFKMQRISVK